MRNVKSMMVAACSLVLSAACSSDFDSQMTLAGYRVVGVEASPPETTPDGDVTLQVHEFLDNEMSTTHEWSLCLHSFGAAESYACTLPEVALGAVTGGVLELQLSSLGIDLRNTLGDVAELPNDDGTPRSYERGFDVWLKLRSGPNCAGCERIDSVKRLTIREGSKETPNTNPSIKKLEVLGTLQAGQKVQLRVQTDPPEAYTDPSSGQSGVEDYLLSWYTSSGEASPTRTFGSDRETDFVLPSEPGEVTVIVTLRDGRGGLAVERRTLSVQ